MIKTSKITGRITFTEERDTEGNLIAVHEEWRGGNVVAITDQLMEDANPVYLHREGDFIYTQRYKLRIVEHDEIASWSLCEYVSG